MPGPQHVKEGPVSQGTRESWAYGVDFAPAASVISPCFALRIDGGSYITACHITGSASVVGTTIRLPALSGLQAADKRCVILIGALVDGQRRWVQNEIEVFDQG